MPRFFTTDLRNNVCYFSKEDALHMEKSLRMKEGEEIVVCDGKGMDYLCKLKKIEDKFVGEILSNKASIGENKIHIHLYMGLSKGDKMDWIIQKGVELGVNEITPISTDFSVVRLKEKEGEKKRARWNKIAYEAAKQCNRGILPVVHEPTSFSNILSCLEGEKKILLYEKGGIRVGELSMGNCTKLSIIVGSEGGFSLDEVNQCKNKGIQLMGIGPRILRCETAPIVGIAGILTHLGEF